MMDSLSSLLPKWETVALFVAFTPLIAGTIWILSGSRTKHVTAPALKPSSAENRTTAPDRSAIEACVAGAAEIVSKDMSKRLGFPVRSIHYGTVIWLVVDRDEHRNAVTALPDFCAASRAALLAASYPPDIVGSISFFVEADETVMRDYGSWWRYLK